MKILYYIILGFVQGLTEFLPVSSSGHLVLVNKIFGYEGNNFLFLSILLHIATLISVFIVLRKEIIKLIKAPFSKQAQCIVLSTVCSAFIVIIFQSFVKESFLGKYLSICFLITAILLILTYFKTQSDGYKKYNEIKYKNAFVIGLVQGVATLPGISRSGSTISTAVMLNVDSQKATNYSFILSIPIIIASLIFEIYDCVKNNIILVNDSVIYIVLSMLVALICGIFAIKIMKKVAKTGKYYYFSVYLIIISIFSLFI